MILNEKIDELDIEEAVDCHIVGSPVYFNHKTLQNVVDPKKGWHKDEAYAILPVDVQKDMLEYYQKLWKEGQLHLIDSFINCKLLCELIMQRLFFVSCKYLINVVQLH